MVIKTDGLTLFGQTKSNFEYVTNHIMECMPKGVTMSFGNIDLRHHVCRLNIDIEKMLKAWKDYGQSLATHGVGPGCYIVLPVLGPSTARDTVASLTNFIGGDAWYNVTVRNNTHYFSDVDYYSSKITDGVDFRAKNYDSIENLEKNSLDFYASVKSLYLQDRQQRILNSKKIIQTQDDSGWEEIETQ